MMGEAVDLPTMDLSYLMRFPLDFDTYFVIFVQINGFNDIYLVGFSHW